MRDDPRAASNASGLAERPPKSAAEQAVSARLSQNGYGYTGSRLTRDVWVTILEIRRCLGIFGICEERGGPLRPLIHMALTTLWLFWAMFFATVTRFCATAEPKRHRHANFDPQKQQHNGFERCEGVRHVRLPNLPYFRLCHLCWRLQ